MISMVLIFLQRLIFSYALNNSWEYEVENATGFTGYTSTISDLVIENDTSKYMVTNTSAGNSSLSETFYINGHGWAVATAIPAGGSSSNIAILTLDDNLAENASWEYNLELEVGGFTQYNRYVNTIMEIGATRDVLGTSYEDVKVVKQEIYNRTDLTPEILAGTGFSYWSKGTGLIETEVDSPFLPDSKITTRLKEVVLN